MNRQRVERTVALKTTLEAVGSTKIDCRDFAGGSVNIPTGSSITTITVYVQTVESGEYCPNAYTITGTAPFNASLVDYVHSARAIELVANAEGNVQLALED